MCLYTENKEPIIAKEDIICYKVLVKTKIPFVYRTPIIRTKIIKIPFFKRTFKAEGHKRLVCEFLASDVRMYEVSVGFIHTYKDLDEALRWVHRLEEENDCVVFVCIIPKGTLYYEGRLNNLASEKIKILYK